MRWIPYTIILFLLLALQCSLGQAIKFSTSVTDTIWPDFLAVMAVFVAMNAATTEDAMMGAWAAGLAADLLAGGSFVIGPMAILFSLVASAVHKMRDTFFCERPGAQFVLGLLFAMVTHLAWVFLQAMIGWSFDGFGSALLQAIGIAVYTGVATPVMCWLVLMRIPRWFLVIGGRRGRR